MMIRFISLVLILTGLALPSVAYGQDIKNVHIIVSLVDNKTQGIVPVPAKLGDGDAPSQNLYWGALYGVKSYLRKQENWTLQASKTTTNGDILEHLIYEWESKDGTARMRVTAEAWRGSSMVSAIASYYDRLSDNSDTEMVVFIGHNGLMDFGVRPTNPTLQSDSRPKDTIILACQSGPYFKSVLEHTNAGKTVTTYGNMAPEAYSLVPALEIWAQNGSEHEMRKAAAAGYAKYQKVPVRNAERLFGL